MSRGPRGGSPETRAGVASRWLPALRLADDTSHRRGGPPRRGMAPVVRRAATVAPSPDLEPDSAPATPCARAARSTLSARMARQPRVRSAAPRSAGSARPFTRTATTAISISDQSARAPSSTNRPTILRTRRAGRSSCGLRLVAARRGAELARRAPSAEAARTTKRPRSDRSAPGQCGAEPLAGPEDAEGGQHQARRRISACSPAPAPSGLWTSEPMASTTTKARERAERRIDRQAVRGADRDDDEDHLDALEQHRLEGGERRRDSRRACSAGLPAQQRRSPWRRPSPRHAARCTPVERRIAFRSQRMPNRISSDADRRTAAPGWGPARAAGRRPRTSAASSDEGQRRCRRRPAASSG